MPIECLIRGPDGVIAEVTPSGELAIAQGTEPDLSTFNKLDVEDQAFHFFPPLPNKQFVMTGLIVTSNKKINATTNADVVIYESGDVGSLVITKTLLQFSLGPNQLLPALGLNILVAVGVFVNAQTTDVDVSMNIIGHYITSLRR